MPTKYWYDVYRGNILIGKIGLSTQIIGKAVVFPTVSILKEQYNRRYETVLLPIEYKRIYDDGVEYRVRRIFNATRKSDRQLNAIGMEWI
jgi:hypothetical protein